MIETSIYNRLSNQLSAVAAGNIFPAQATENCSLPFIVYTVSDSDPIRTLQGLAGWKHDLTIDAFDINFDTVKTIALQVMEALEGWQESPVVYATQTSASAEAMEFGHQYSLSFLVYEAFIPEGDSELLLEDGSALLLEDGTGFLLEDSLVNSLQMEDGSDLQLEDGSLVLMEST